MKFGRSLLLCSVFISGYSTYANAEVFTQTHYETCFTPGQDCTSLIVSKIDSAQKEILIQAYSFTSAPIAQAIINAKKRGVSVKAILDKGQFSAQYSAAKFLLNQGVPVWKDYKVAIAHNKVIIIDSQKVITGSFNFTKAAQNRNAENVMIIEDKKLANAYSKNWQSRQDASIRVNQAPLQ